MQLSYLIAILAFNQFRKINAILLQFMRTLSQTNTTLDASDPNMCGFYFHVKAK